MRRRPRLVLAAVALVLASAARAAEPSVEAVEAVIEGYVRPAYAGFAEKSATAVETLDALCAAPSPDSLQAAREAFAREADAWSFVEPIRFGPITEENRLERVLFWPDRRSLGLKQVQRILATRDETAISAATLVQKSVAVQGLGALEFVLFGTGSQTLAGAGSGFRCAYGLTVAHNIAGISSEVVERWRAADGIAGLWTRPSPDNPLYRDATEAVAETFDILVHGLELVRDVRIGGFLGDDPGRDRPKQALYWRSGRTVAAIRRNLEGLRAVYERSGLGDDLGSEAEWIDRSIRFEFDNAQRALSGLDGPVADLLADGTARGRIAYARLVTASLSELIGRRLSAEYGLTAGFSSLDGD